MSIYNPPNKFFEKRISTFHPHTQYLLSQLEEQENKFKELKGKLAEKKAESSSDDTSQKRMEPRPIPFLQQLYCSGPTRWVVVKKLINLSINQFFNNK